MSHYFFRAFPALLHKNYRLWFAGQLTSLVGTWIQMVAQGWLVLQLTNSPLWVGIIAALNSLPVLLLTLFAGVLVDKFSKKKILFIAESGAMVLAIILGILTLTGTVTVYHVAILAFLLGIVNAIDMPARMSFAAELVEKESLSSALALNAGMFNGARVVGPGIAGYLISIIGLGGAFIINGFSFFAVLLALFFIKVKPRIPNVHPHPLLAIRQGISYSFSHSLIKSLLIYAAVASIFGWSYIVIMPVIVKDVFKLDVAGLGFFNAVAGLGAVVASIMVSALSRRINYWIFIIGGGILLSISLLIFSATTNIVIGLISLFFIGMGLLMQFATINATIQHNVIDSFRGRVMSIYAFMFMGLTPIGSMQIGLLSEYFGAQIALRVGAIALLCFSFLYLYLNTITKKSE